MNIVLPTPQAPQAPKAPQVPQAPKAPASQSALLRSLSWLAGEKTSGSTGILDLEPGVFAAASRRSSQELRNIVLNGEEKMLEEVVRRKREAARRLRERILTDVIQPVMFLYPPSLTFVAE